ncbi:WRKY transcription factor WRKY24 [Senna tora]|uniref:WRKY transcription factor WRKY24 n=1 Tax=Senna tora TaxID=362788 RepID=A0A834WWU7_9FABA|nr:WRKY transcription factor WRKY24 [Senna tora]
MELLQDHNLRSGKFNYKQHHVICKQVETLKEFSAQTSFGFSDFDAHNFTNLGFEVDLLNFFLGCLTIQLMKINLMLGFLAAIFCYFLIVLRSNSNPQLEIGAIRDEDHVEVEVIETVVIGDGARNHQNQTLRRRFDDGYNWKKYEEKQVKGSGNYTSYYKCTNPNCSVKKRIERCVDGKGSEVIYKGTHNHCKPKHASLNRNSSFETLPAIHPSKMVPIEIPYQQLDSVDTPDNSSVSI